MKLPKRLAEKIAKEHLMIDTLETRRSDSLDFHDVSVWGAKDALQAAFDAGVAAAASVAKGKATRERKAKDAAANRVVAAEVAASRAFNDGSPRSK